MTALKLHNLSKWNHERYFCFWNSDLYSQIAKIITTVFIWIKKKSGNNHSHSYRFRYCWPKILSWTTNFRRHKDGKRTKFLVLPTYSDINIFACSIAHAPAMLACVCMYDSCWYIDLLARFYFIAFLNMAINWIERLNLIYIRVRRWSASILIQLKFNAQ